MEIYSFRHIQESIDKKFPKLFEICYPRAFATPGGFESPKRVAYSFANFLLSGIRNPRTGAFQVDKDEIVKSCYLSICALSKYNFPTFFISKPLLLALAQSDLPNDFKIDEIKWPFPALTFILPNNVLQSSSGPITHFTITRHMKDEVYRSPIPQSKFFTCTNDYVHVCTRALDAKVPFLYSLTFELKLNDFGEMKNVLANTTIDDQNTMIFRLEEDESQLLLRLFAIGIQSLFILEEKPELLESERRIRAAKKEGEKEFWSPNFVGRNYTLRSESDQSEGTHASPRMHWRRGHWKNQVHGQGRSLRKRIWIEPFIVYGKDENS